MSEKEHDFGQLQHKWDALFNRHRLTLVTHGNEKVLQFFEELHIVSGTQKKDSYKLFLENKYGTCRLTVSFIADSFWQLDIDSDKRELLYFTDLGVRMCTPEWGLSSKQETQLVPFFQEIRRFIQIAAKDNQLLHYV